MTARRCTPRSTSGTTTAIRQRRTRSTPTIPRISQWIDVWIEIRDEVLIAATNEHFFEQYPGAPQHLDPNDPAQQLYVMEWVRIRDEILGDGVTSPYTDSSANTTEEPAAATYRRTVDGAVRPGSRSRS